MAAKPRKQVEVTPEPEPDMTGMRIVELRAENVKRLVAVEIKPDGKGGLVIIGGNNGAGKSSVIDSILYALGGKKATAKTPKVIRDGEDHASVRLDLGELIVTRTWKASGTDQLEVMTKDGHKLAEKQGLLDTLIGPLSFDPLAFLNMKPADQRQTLLDLIELPFNLTELDAERSQTYTQRTDVNRQLKSARSEVENLNGELSGISDSPPSLEDALSRKADAAQLKTLADRNIDEYAHSVDMLESAEAAVKGCERLLQNAQVSLDQANERAASRRADLESADRRRRESVAKAQEVDMAAIEADIDVARAAAAEAGKISERDRMEEQAKSLAVESEQLSVALDAIDRRKADGLATASMPVDGLGFDDDGVTLNGLPLSQASGAEALRVSTAIAMAKAPLARIILCKDGSLLDAENLAMLAQLTKANGYQLWLERVGDADKSAIVIEAGEVRA